MESLEKVSPPRLYLFADGPRTGKAGEAELCAETRKVAEACIRWPCEVIRQYSDKNLGLKNSIESGLDLLFLHEEFAVFLEDDCLPSTDFFRFCEYGDTHYAVNLQIGAVTGNCFLRTKNDLGQDYYFSRYPHCWGWATWKNRWKSYDRSDYDWSSYRNLFPEASVRESKYWDKIYADLKKFDSWAYPWQAHFWKKKYLCLSPFRNLVRNTGFGPDGTHTKDLHMTVRWGHEGPLAFPLRRPLQVSGDPALDQAVFRNFYLALEGKRSLWQKIRDRWRKSLVTQRFVTLL